MIVLLGIILVSRVHGRSFVEDSESSKYPKFNPNYLIRGSAMDKIKEEYNALVNMKDNEGDNNEFDIISEEERIFSNGQFGTERDRELIQTYILVKTMRQRNKRYTSYLTLCHFKICNIGNIGIGKKRRPSYIYGTKNQNYS